MNLFLGFILLCFITAIVLRKRSLRTSVWILGALGVLLGIGYFFFRQI